jgi:hypothetical protein
MPTMTMSDPLTAATTNTLTPTSTNNAPKASHAAGFGGRLRSTTPDQLK